MALPQRLARLKGRSSKPFVFEVEKNMVRRYARAVGETNPIHFDEDIAKVAGFSGLVAPIGFLSALDNTEPLLEILDLSEPNLMHSEEEYEYFSTICSGHAITVIHKVIDIYQSNAPQGVLTFFVIETRGTTAKGKDAFKGRRVLVEMG